MTLLQYGMHCADMKLQTAQDQGIRLIYLFQIVTLLDFENSQYQH